MPYTAARLAQEAMGEHVWPFAGQGVVPSLPSDRLPRIMPGFPNSANQCQPSGFPPNPVFGDQEFRQLASNGIPSYADYTTNRNLPPASRVFDNDDRRPASYPHPSYYSVPAQPYTPSDSQNRSVSPPENRPLYQRGYSGDSSISSPQEQPHLPLHRDPPQNYAHISQQQHQQIHQYYQQSREQQQQQQQQLHRQQIPPLHPQSEEQLRSAAWSKEPEAWERNRAYNQAWRSEPVTIKPDPTSPRPGELFSQSYEQVLRREERPNQRVETGYRSQDSEVVTPFISKLSHLLSHGDYHSFIRWNREGTAFIFLHTSQDLLSVFSRFFRHSNANSFVRQLNNYGFTRLTTIDLLSAVDDRSSPTPVDTAGDFSGFKHPMFYRDQPGRICPLARIKPKATLTKKSQQVKLPTPPTPVASEDPHVKRVVQAGTHVVQDNRLDRKASGALRGIGTSANNGVTHNGNVFGTGRRF